MDLYNEMSANSADCHYNQYMLKNTVPAVSHGLVEFALKDTLDCLDLFRGCVCDGTSCDACVDSCFTKNIPEVIFKEAFAHILPPFLSGAVTKLFAKEKTMVVGGMCMLTDLRRHDNVIAELQLLDGAESHTPETACRALTWVVDEGRAVGRWEDEHVWNPLVAEFKEFMSNP